MSKSYKISDPPGGACTLSLRGDLTEADRAALEGRHYINVLIRHGDHSDLDYLEPSFGVIRCLDVGSQRFDWSAIAKMPALETLKIGAYWKIPWREFNSPSLQSLSVTWDKSYSISDLNFPALDHLKIISWSADGLEALTRFETLAYLDLVDSRKLKSLKGLRRLSFLRTLLVRGAPKLTSLEGVQYLEQLVVLHLDGLRGIANYQALADLESVLGLVMHGCAPIPSLALLSALPKLEFLVLGDCKIEDGDTAVIKTFPALRKVMFKNKRGYNWKSREAKDHFEELFGGEPEFSAHLESALTIRL